MALPDLFKDGDSEDENCDDISINKAYAKKYQKFKECQELDKLKQKYANGYQEEESSSTSESEDDDAEALTPQIERDFLDTLSMIKQKDPKIYEKDSIFFSSATNDNTDDKTNKKLPSKSKNKQPMLLKDYESQRLLEKGEKAYLSDSGDEGKEIEEYKKLDDLTYVEEQEQLKQSFKTAADSSSSDDEHDLLQVREKTTEEVEDESLNHKLENTSSMGGLNRYWNNDQLGDDEKFLRDYILKKQFIIPQFSKIPSYNEVVGSFENDDDDEDDEDSDQAEKEEKFDRKFNFRYEDPDPEFIKQYPRTINETVRRKDDRRKQQRKLREERKKKEQEKKKDELKRLKNLKRKEIMEKIEKIKDITGNQKVGFLEDDMQHDFDIAKYDKLMEEVFDDEYYNDSNMVEEEKPVFPDDDNEEYYEDYEDYTNEDYLPNCEDEDFNMDADYDPEIQPIKKKNLSKKRGMNVKFAQVIQKEKPVFDPKEKTFEEYFDEYYKLDYEDIIGDMPIRFKYREVTSNDFGLTTGEILKAEDKELNEWCSLRKTMQYIGEDEEKKERLKYKKKSRNKNKKLQVFNSLREEIEEENSNNPNFTKIMEPRNIGKLQKKKSQLHNRNIQSKHLMKRKTLVPSWNNQQRRSILSSVNKSKIKNIRKQFRGGDDRVINKLSLERLAAYGLDERKKKSN